MSDAFDAAELARLTHALVRIPSETGDEAAIADDVERRCRALAATAVERIGHSVVARCGDGEPALALVGHLDTVPAWPGHAAVLDGLRVVGRGAADMKGGDAAILAVLERCAQRGIPLVAVFYEAEEGPHERNGIHRVLAESRLLGRPPFALVAEPTRCVVHAGCVGVLNADVRFGGRSAHSARPWEGENAILRALPFLTRAAAQAAVAVEVDGLTFHDTLTVTRAAAGVARNVVPDRCELAVNLRFAPGRDAAQARRALEELVAGEGEIEWLDEAPASPPDLENPALREFLALTGLPVEPKQAWTDVATLSAHGIPAANYGPGDPAQAHQPGEWVDGAAVAEVAGNLMRLLEARSKAGG